MNVPAFYTLFFRKMALGCKNNKGKEAKTSSPLVHLITLAPRHFHAALLQKAMYDEVDTSVSVFAPEGAELQSHFALIIEYNSRRKRRPPGMRQCFQELATWNK